MKKLKVFVYVILAITLNGCFGGGGDSSGTTLLSDINIKCTDGQVNNCLIGSHQGRDILIGLIFDNEQTCLGYLETILNKNQFSQYFDVSASGITIDNNNTLGAVLPSPWVDYVGGPVVAVNANISQITVCGFIDLDNDGVISSGDAYYDSAYEINAGHLVLSLWDQY